MRGIDAGFWGLSQNWHPPPSLKPKFSAHQRQEREAPRVPVGANDSPGPGLHAEGSGSTRGGLWGAWEGQKYRICKTLTRAGGNLEKMTWELVKSACICPEVATFSYLIR